MHEVTTIPDKKRIRSGTTDISYVKPVLITELMN